MTRSRRLTVIVVAVAALAGACSDDDENGSADSTTAAPTAEDPTTTMETTTTSTAATTTTTTLPPETTTTTTVPPTTPTAPPPTTPEQIDWIPIVEEVYGRKFALLAQPDPAGVGVVASEGNPAYESLLQNVTGLIAQGLRIVADPFKAVRVDLGGVLQTSPAGEPLLVTLIVWGGAPNGKVVDADGNVFSTLEPPPAGTVTRTNVTIGRVDVNQPWLFFEETVLSPTAP